MYVLLALLFSVLARADQDIMEATMLDVASAKSSIAQKREAPSREVPGIITVVSRQEIVNSGVRDLKEALALFVPGVSFAGDVDGVTGIAIRGLFGHEGKVLVMMDNIPLNEEVYSTTQFDNHYPAEMIERIEVLRGPGSIVHGEYALIGVINVITRQPTNGYFIAGRDSEMSKTFSHRNWTGGVGNTTGDFKYSLLTSFGEGNRSQGIYTDAAGDSMSSKGNYTANPKLVNLGLQYKGLSFRAIEDRYETTHMSLADTLLPDHSRYSETFETRGVELKYQINATDNLGITPYLGYRESHPWRIIRPGDYQFSKYSTRQTAGVTADWNVNSALRILAGEEFSVLKIRIEKRDDSEDPFQYFPDGLTNQFWVQYAEGTYKTTLADFTLGGRYEEPLHYRSTFVPRIGINKAFEEWHYKIMGSQSYRVPAGIHQDRVLSTDTKLKPEIATNFEIETGYIFSQNLFASLNFFDIRIDDPIVFQTLPGAPSGAYYNADRFGTRGAEAEAKYNNGRYEITSNLAYYDRAHENGTSYSVPGRSDSYIAMPTWRSNLITTVHLNRQLALVPSATFESASYGFTGDGSDPTLLGHSAGGVYLNFNVRYTDLIFKGLEASAGIMNLTNREHLTYQAYNGDFAPLPGLSRSFNAMLAYGGTF
jgi:outer membrane receptor protein involved in Fe transport